ncbi:MAG: hypothetical protein OXI80_01875 [Caldilineaceae bacterium]|nr:hypothetical protein [Caldilineaceae bacterium]MDE0336394.1 hypothetical protein [Caldilineaceae bacterium]
MPNEITVGLRVGTDAVQCSGPLFVDTDGPLAHAACRATGAARAVTVPCGTKATYYRRYMDALVLGPGNIDQAHTVGERIAIE